MGSNQLAALLMGLVFLGGGLRVALADCPMDAPADQSVSLESPGALESCSSASKERARLLANEARRQGAHRRAGDCYLQAGDHVQADRSYLKASRLATADTSQQLADTTDDAREQARRLRNAFRRH